MPRLNNCALVVADLQEGSYSVSDRSPSGRRNDDLTPATFLDRLDPSTAGLIKTS
jgi:hypothetical protein